MKTKLLTICLLLFTSQVFAKEYTLYDCKVDGNEKKSYENYMACDRNCKKTNRKLKIKVNQTNNKVLLIHFENTKELFRELLENEERNITDINWWTQKKELKIFDKNNWSLEFSEMTGGTMSTEAKDLTDGKIFRHIFLIDSSSWSLKKYICGK